jgi:biofilm PGA synthesis lipoprotein PgaB
MDFLSHAVNRIRIRGIQVYVWMPVLSFELPDTEYNKRLKVKEFKDHQVQTTTSWYRRLSPFDERSRAVIKDIYKDLAAHVRFDGILFHDDAYLTDYEDFHPAAQKTYMDLYGTRLTPSLLKQDNVKARWTQLKTETLDLFIEELIEIIKQYRPLARVARNIYSVVLLNPYAQEWFSQNFDNYLKNYDYTVIMAYPQMEGIFRMNHIKQWFNQLVEKVNEKHAQKKVIFKIQSYDWKKNQWISEDILRKELRFLLASGVSHVAYYPDNVFENRPEIVYIGSILSARNLPSTWRQK